MERELTINNSVCGRWFLCLIALFLMSVGMQAEETSTTYTFTGMSAVSGEDYKYEVTSTSGEASETWKIMNFSATDEGYNNRSTSGYVLETESLGISNIFATSTSATIIDFQLVSDFVLHGNFVSAEITYSTSGMYNSKAVVYKVGNSSYKMLTDTSEPLGTSPATISLKSVYEDEKYFNGQKVALSFTFKTNKFDGSDGAFSIQSIKITTTPPTEVCNLWVGGVQVNSGNASNILNDDNNPTAVFDLSSNTLTLNGATISGNVVSGLADGLTVHLVGTNTILTQGTKAFVSELQSEPSLTFTAANGGLLKTNILRTEGDAVITSGFNFSKNSDIPEDYKMSWDADGYCSLGKYYGLYLYAFVNGDGYFQPYYVTAANCDRLMGKYNESNSKWDNTVITISYDDSEKTLTLNNASPETAAPYGDTYLINCDEANAKNITIILLGENTLRQYPNEDAAGFIRNSQHEGTVTITTDLENPGTLTMPDFEESKEESSIISADNVIYKNGLGYSKDENNVRYIKTLPSYGLKVAGIPVNSSNASDVLGDGKISYDAENHMLTLNGAQIDAYNNEAIVSGLDNLTVFLVGESSIFGGSPTFSKTSDVENATITFTTDGESMGSLFINNLQQYLFGEGVTPVYSNVFIKHEGDGHTIDCLLDVRVGIVEVTSFNKDNVLGDGKVSYNAETHTLTLNNATIGNDGSDPEPMETSGVYYSGTDDFTINLIGTNTINSGNCSAIRGGQTPKLIFTKAGEQPASLQMETTESSVIDGFSVVEHEGLFLIEDQIFGMDCPTTYSVLVSSTLLGGGSGTAADPLLIKTTEDLTTFAYYICTDKISRDVSVKLYNDIDCEGLSNFAPIGYGNYFFDGTFDGNGKAIKNLTITDNAGDCVGLFRILGEHGMIKDLTIDNLTLSGGNSSSNNIGGLVGILNGGTVSNCMIKNSTISCKTNSLSPTVGGLVGELSSGSITDCTVQACTVNAVTQDTSNSGPVAQAGGIVGNASGGTITGCQVKGATTVTADYGAYMATVSAGAIVARKGEVTLSNNTYEYSVTTSTNKYDGETTHLTTKSGYEQRGIGGQTYNEQTQQNEDNPDLFDDNGAVMYTKKVTLPAESTQATVIGEEGTYYSTVMESDVLSILVAPGQTATLNAIPGDGLAIASLTVTNTTTSEAITTTATLIEDNEKQYTFTMPDAPVTVAVTTATAYGISIAGVTVTELNAANILGDGTVSYNASKHTLTLNDATIGNDGSGSDPMEACGIDYSETADLTISLKGTNTIYGMGGCNAIRYNGQGDVAPKLIFTKGDDQECSLQLNTSSDDEGTAISGGFSEIQGVWGVGAIDNGLAIIADKEVKYDSEDGLTIEKVVNYTVNYVPLSSTLITSYYGLAISGVPVYEGNKSNITGEGIYGNGTASFDLTTNTLTLNNVNLNPDYAQNDGDLRVSIVTSLAQLNINLIGESQTYAIKTTNESGTLTFKSAEANRGAARLNFWYNAEPYYIGFGENKVTYNDGLCLRNSSSNSSFPKVVALYVPKVVTEEKERGLYYPDHEFTFSMEEEVEGFDIYYANMLGGDPVKTTNGKFTLAEGRYTLRVYPIYPGMDTDPSRNSQFASERYAKVIAKPTFSKENGTYNESFTLTLQNIPEQDAREEWADGLSENIMVPQVWYFINDNKNDSIRYDATKGISVTESCKVSVYVIDVDSAKKLKSTPVEAHYVIRQDAGLAYTQNNESVEVAEYTIGGENNPALPTLQNENELAVTFSSEDENVATVNAETGAVTIVGVGRTTISATSEQTDVLLAGEASYLLTVYKDLSHESITVTVADMTYTGEAVEPEVTVMDGETDITGYVTVAYSNNVAVGTSALVTITPKTADVNYYVGSTTQTFSIVNRTLEIGKDVNFASGQKWASFYTTTENLELPDGVMAYIVTGVSTEAVTVKAINYVPKDVPVLIENESTTTTDNTSAEGNQLQGTSESTAVSGIEGHVYVLYNGGFTRATSGAIPAGRAYLVLEQEVAARLLIVEEEATDISEIERMSNGGNESWYSLDGQKLQKKPTKKGMYIVNGQKVVIK